MSYFTKKVTKTYEFEDDTIEVTMRRLKKKDAIKIAPKLGEPDENGNFQLKFAEQIEFMEVASEILPKYVDEFSGLKDLDGGEITIESICGEDSEAYFVSLLSEIFGDLMECSFAKDKDKEDKKDKNSDEKKSDVQLENTSVDTENTPVAVSEE